VTTSFKGSSFLRPPPFVRRGGSGGIACPHIQGSLGEATFVAGSGDPSPSPFIFFLLLFSCMRGIIAF
jgi:hypothetical protein